MHQNLKNEETIAGGDVDVKDVVGAGLCVEEQCSMFLLLCVCVCC